MNKAIWLGILAIKLALFDSLIALELSEVQRIVQRKEKEVATAAEFAQQVIKKGITAFSHRNYENAFLLYKSALDSLPSAGSATQRLRTTATRGLANSVVASVRQKLSEGSISEVYSLLEILRQYCPNDTRILTLQKQLKSDKVKPLMANFVVQVKKISRLLREAKDFYQSGRYDLAFKRYEQVLNIDKYHIAARRGQVEIEKARLRYAEEAYKERRAEMMAGIDQAWELPGRNLDTEVSSIIEQPHVEAQGKIHRKLDEIIIPHVNFYDTPLREALQYVRQRAAALDVTESDPTRKGVNIILKATGDQANIPLTLQLSDVPLRSVLVYLMEGANMKLKVEPYAIVAVPLSEPTEAFITKEYRVSPSFISQLPGFFASGAESLLSENEGRVLAAGSQPAIVARSGAKEFLEAQGVTFPPGASANYLPSSSCLIVKNTQANLDLIDSLVEQSIGSSQKQVNIETKFVEITQHNAQELGFDWLLGQFQLPFGSGIYGSGGGDGVASPQHFQNFPIRDAQGGPVGMLKSGAGRLTGGNRSGTLAIQLNALDTLFFGGGSAIVTPGVLALAGVFTDPQFQLVIRALHQKKGVDLMTAPSITTKSGHAARIQIVREFRYPTQFDPPQVPPTQTFGISPLTPTTPSAFETKNIGIELDVTPTVGPDGKTIDLILQPRVTEFEGFINYGSQIDTIAPITSSLGLATGATATVKLSDNTIHQPVFSIREANTQVTITDGSTIVLGGLIQEKIQKVRDKTPILGNIPLVGRLFQTDTERRVKTNLIMFVTANLIDPGGQSIVMSEAETSIRSTTKPAATFSIP